MSDLIENDFVKKAISQRTTMLNNKLHSDLLDWEITTKVNFNIRTQKVEVLYYYKTQIKKYEIELNTILNQNDQFNILNKMTKDALCYFLTEKIAKNVEKQLKPLTATLRNKYKQD